MLKAFPRTPVARYRDVCSAAKQAVGACSHSAVADFIQDMADIIGWQSSARAAVAGAQACGLGGRGR